MAWGSDVLASGVIRHRGKYRTVCNTVFDHSTHQPHASNKFKSGIDTDLVGLLLFRERLLNETSRRDTIGSTSRCYCILLIYISLRLCMLEI